VKSLSSFLLHLLEEGSVILREYPAVRAGEHAEAAQKMEPIYANFRLNVAGPLLPFDAAIALKAAECYRSACWFLLDRQAEASVVEAAIAMPTPNANAAQHLSVDLIFRFLPPLLKRARAIDPDDVLTRSLTRLCRQWPLSGVLADVADAPLTSLNFEGHPGLQLLYAERLADHPRAEWTPAAKSLEYLNLVLSERGERP
jgi:hypothetical protein